MPSETQSYGQFFMAQIKIVGWQITGEIALIVAGTPPDGTFEQPLANPIFRAATQLADLAEQWRNMDGIAKPSGQRWAAQLLDRFHGENISWWG